MTVASSFRTILNSTYVFTKRNVSHFPQIIRSRETSKKKGNMVVARLLAYWLTISATCWTLAFMYFCNAEKAFRRFDTVSDMVRCTISRFCVKNQ